MRRWGVLVMCVFVAGVAAIPSVSAGSGDEHAGHGSPATTRAGAKVGVLLADHGEPPEYNEWTYESFREFFSHLIAMGVIPSWLSSLETGTILYDADCPACGEARAAPRLIDAWLRPHDGPAVFVPASDSLPAHYVIPGGPGFREPDIYEHVGLSAWHEWQRMGGRSPNYDEKLVKKQHVLRRLQHAYGDSLAVGVGYGIDPRIGGGRQGVREALDALVNRDRVESLVVVYHGVGFSDIMQTHHLRHQIADHLDSLGRGDMPIRYADPIGVTAHYVTAIVEKVKAEVALLPDHTSVAVHLSGHGLSTTMCGEYDCGADAYHRYAADLFARVKPALEAAIDRPGRTGVFHVYGDSGEGDADPENEVASPIEALDARATEDWTHVVDVPYEFDSNSRDTLIVLRQGYRRAQPDWNRAWESHFTYKDMKVKIANANGGEAHKTSALEAVTVAALGALAEPMQAAVSGGAPPDAKGAHAHASTGAASAASGGGAAGGGAAAHAHPAASPSSHHDASSVGTRFDRIGENADAHAHGGAGSATGGGGGTRGSGAPGGGGADHQGDAHDGEVMTQAGHAHGGGGAGAGAGVGLLLALAGGAALAGGVAARGRPPAGRLAAGGLGAQLAGLGWDVVTHAQAGEGVHLLENGGHWVTMLGLVVTGAAAAMLLRVPRNAGSPASA
ncbi:MAG TPA: hypothetical protein VF230_01300 [Acidimicrobiales bacterium]